MSDKKCTYSHTDGLCGTHQSWNGYCRPGHKPSSEETKKSGPGTSGVRDAPNLADLDK